MRWALLAPFYKWVICPGHMVGNTCISGRESPTALDNAGDTSANGRIFYFETFLFMHILKTQQPSVTMPHKETSGSLWHNWVDNSGLYIFYTLVIFPSLYAGYFKFQNWPEDFAWIYGAFWSHWVTMGNIAPDVHSQIMLHDAFCRRLLLFIKRIFVSFNSRRGHIWTFAHNYWGLSLSKQTYN